MARHVAIKCNYNDGDEGIYVGFNGTCSNENIFYNIEERGAIWCTQEGCECRQYYEKGFRGKRPINPCMESVLFKYWEFGAGTFHTGDKAGEPIHFNDTGLGKIAVLTTRFRGEEEKDRKIIGLFKIGKVYPEDVSILEIKADGKNQVRLPLEEAKELYFWDYYKTKGGVIWGSRLQRYLSDEQVANILIDLEKTVSEERIQTTVKELLESNFPGFNSTIIYPTSRGEKVARTERIGLQGKYGPTGESENHKKLKKWVINNYRALNIKGVKKIIEEYQFPSGDRADILFVQEGNRSVVVEVKTIDPYPGCYQVLKYKALRCAEIGIGLGSNKVGTLLVGPHSNKEIDNFCRRYGIRYIEKP